MGTIILAVALFLVAVACATGKMSGSQRIHQNGGRGLRRQRSRLGKW